MAASATCDDLQKKFDSILKSTPHQQPRDTCLQDDKTVPTMCRTIYRGKKFSKKKCLFFLIVIFLAWRIFFPVLRDKFSFSTKSSIQSSKKERKNDMIQESEFVGNEEDVETDDPLFQLFED